MKIIKAISLIVLALILIAATGIFILFQTFDADGYLPQITQKASLVLGRPVSIGHLGLGFSLQGITLDAWPITVADAPGFTSLPFIEVERVRMIPDLGALILKRKIQVAGVLVQSPQIHFIISPQGRSNVQSIIDLKTHPSSGEAKSNGKGIEGPVIAAVPRAFSADFSIKSIKIRDASISFIDQVPGMPMDIWLNDINANIDGFSLVKPFQFLSNASLYSSTPNVHAGFMMALDLAKHSIQVNDLRFDADLSGLNAEGLKDISLGMQDSVIFENITGTVRLNLDHLDAGPSGLEADGNINATGFVIKNFNIVRTLFSPMLEIFGGLNIDNLFKGPLKDKLGAPDTVIEDAHAQFSFHDKTLFIPDSAVQTDLFEFRGNGSISQVLDVDMQAMVHLNEDVSASIVDEFKGFKYLMDDSRRIAIDGTIKGVIPHVTYKLNKDVRKKAKKALMQEGGNILSAFLGGL